MERPAWLQKEVFKRIIYEQEMYDEKRRNSECKTAIRMGRDEGINVAKLETAKNLKARGIADDIIAECTGLPLETIQSL